MRLILVKVFFLKWIDFFSSLWPSRANYINPHHSRSLPPSFPLSLPPSLLFFIQFPSSSSSVSSIYFPLVLFIHLTKVFLIYSVIPNSFLSISSSRILYFLCASFPVSCSTIAFFKCIFLSLSLSHSVSSRNFASDHYNIISTFPIYFHILFHSPSLYLFFLEAFFVCFCVFSLFFSSSDPHDHIFLHYIPSTLIHYFPFSFSISLSFLLSCY